MSSINRIASSRANGARSSGPKTPEGKRRSAANSLRHGLLAKHVVLETEDRACFDALYAEFIGRFSPSDGVELGVIEEMVNSFWRQRRVWAIETRMLDAAIAAQPASVGVDDLGRMAAGVGSLAAQPALSLVHRYETRLHRIFQRAFRNLLLLQNRNMPNEPSFEPGLPDQEGAFPSSEDEE